MFLWKYKHFKKGIQL